MNDANMDLFFNRRDEMIIKFLEHNFFRACFVCRQLHYSKITSLDLQKLFLDFHKVGESKGKDEDDQP